MKINLRDKVAKEIAKAKLDTTWWIPLRELCRTYTVPELEIALEFVSVPLDKYAVEIVSQALEKERHKELTGSNQIIKWALIVAVMTLIVAYLAWMLPRSPVADARKFPTVQQSAIVAQPASPMLQNPLPNSAPDTSKQSGATPKQ